MRIAYLSKEYPPYGLNFASALFYPQLAVALVDLGHQVHIISQAVNGQYDGVEHGIYIHRTGPTQRVGSPFTRMQYNLAAWLKLREIITKYDLQIVDAPITFGEGFLYSLSKNTPLVLQTFAFSDMFLKTKSYSGTVERFSYILSSFMENISMKRAEMIVANSPQTYRYLLEEKRLSPHKVKLIWESRIDLNKWRFTPSNVRSKFGIPDGVPLILFVGWLQARKGVHILIDAIPKILGKFSESMFLLVGRDTNSAPGGGSCKQYVLERARQFGFLNNVKIVEDFLPDIELIQLYSSCDIFLFPSLSETFGWPTVEAMACGRPVVATETGIAVEFRGVSQTFKLIPPGDSAAIVLAISELLSMPKIKRDSLSASHRQAVEEIFSPQRMIQNYIDVYEEKITEYRDGK